MTTTHDVKIEPRWHERIRQNEKFAEIRYDDRDYQTGDRIRFWRNDEPEWTGAAVERVITHVLREVDGLEHRFVVLSLADPRVRDYRERWENALERERTLEHRVRGLRGRITRLEGQVTQ